MRILYITDALAVWGGIERVLCDKANYLVAHYGYDVHIVTTDQGDHPIPYPFDERVHIRDLNIRSHHQYRYRGLKRLIKYFELNRLFLKRLKEAISEIKPDVIVCIRIESINTIVKAKGNIPLICESHSMFYAYRYEKASFWYRLRLRLSRRNMRKADCIVALTEGDANDWRQVNKDVCVIPNVVHLNETGRYSDLSSKVVLFVGRFSEQKDVWSLLEIWKLVHKQHPDWELHAYGEGELKEDFIKAIDKNDIGIRVFPPTPDIFEKYLNSSMLIMTSLYEPFGLVLPEAMSCGIPVIAFNCPYGPADIVTDGKDGYLIDNRNIQSFADKVILLMRDKQQRCQIGRFAAQSAMRYHPERIMIQWQKLFPSHVKNDDEDILKHKFIIIGSDHSNTLGQLRCLGEKGIRPIVVITEQQPYLITRSKYLGELHQVNSISEAPRYVAEHWGNEPIKPFVYTDRDDFMCAIDDCYDLLDGKFYFWNAGSKGRIKQLINKEEQMAIAAECGLKVIPTERVKRGELPKNLEYPIFTKATNSLNPFWKANAFVCHNEKELMDAYKHMGIDDVLLQKYIEKVDETPIEGISIDGGREVKLLVKKSSYRFVKNGFGVFSQMLAFDDYELEKKIASFMQRTGYTGIFEVEFIVDKSGETYFMEVNLRNTMFNHACADFGANIPWLFAKWTLDNQINVLDFSLSDKPHLVMYEFDDLKESCIHGPISLRQWLTDFFHSSSYLYFDKRDMGPFLVFANRKITNCVLDLFGMKKL